MDSYLDLSFSYVRTLNVGITHFCTNDAGMKIRFCTTPTSCRSSFGIFENISSGNIVFSLVNGEVK